MTKINIFRKDDYVPVWDLQKKEIVDADVVVISDTEIKIRFDYPCDDTIFEFENVNGFTNWDLYKAIKNGYNKIYGNEKKYGVWGHVIQDLSIEEIKYNPKKKLVTMFIGS